MNHTECFFSRQLNAGGFEMVLRVGIQRERFSTVTVHRLGSQLFFPENPVTAARGVAAKRSMDRI